jgi:hypothetical protein
MRVSSFIFLGVNNFFIEENPEGREEISITIKREKKFLKFVHMTMNQARQIPDCESMNLDAENKAEEGSSSAESQFQSPLSKRGRHRKCK